MAEQDVILPNRPLMLLHKDWQRSTETDYGRSSRGRNVAIGPSQSMTKQQMRAEVFKPQTSSKPTTFRFVDHSGPPKRRAKKQKVQSESLRKLKTPIQCAGQDVPSSQPSGGAYKASAKPSLPSENEESVEGLPAEPSPLSRNIPGSATALYGGALPIKLTCQYNDLISYYFHAIASALYPLEEHLQFNPVRTTWFPLAITDEVFFSAMLSVSVSLRSRSSRNYPLDESNLLMSSVYRNVNSRLRYAGPPSDTTISAVTCLVMREQVQGKYDDMKTHMVGLKEMIRLRSACSSIDNGLRLKAYRADTGGAVRTLSRPYLLSFQRTQPSISSLIPACMQMNVDRQFVASLRSTRLIGVMNEIHRLGCTLDQVLKDGDVRIDPMAMDEDTIQIQRDLVEIYCDGDGVVERLYCMASLIYVKFLTRRFVYEPEPLINAYLTSINGIILEQIPSSSSKLWLLFMAGMITTTSGTEHPLRLINELANITRSENNSFLQWQSVREKLRTTLWVDMLLDKLGHTFWREAIAIFDTAD